MHECQEFLTELFNDALKTSQVNFGVWGPVQRYRKPSFTVLSDAKFIRCCSGTGSYETPRENQVCRICVRSRTVPRAQDERNSK
jgi:hypothetical protein